MSAGGGNGAVVPIRRDDPVLERLAARLVGAGASHDRFAAAVLVARGRRAEDQQTFAEHLGVPLGHLQGWESGRRPATHAPRRLRTVAPDLDWTAAGVTEPGHPTDPATRHPAAGRRTAARPF